MARLIKINEYSKTPKYKQIVNSILEGIESGELKVDDKLPSVNKLLIEFDISRDTVVKAYEALKDMELIDSIPGKGYYIKSNKTKRAAKVFLLFNKLSAHKKIIYDAFSQALGDKVSIDFFIYNNNYRLFKELIISHKNKNYTHYVIIPHFMDGGEDAHELINQIPSQKLIILDKKIKGIKGNYAAVYQDFEKNIYDALTKALQILKNYQCIKIIFPPYSYHPVQIVTGFIKFCVEYAFEYKIVGDISSEPIQANEVYINLMEDDLVTLIKRVKKKDLKVGRDVGIISYNETPLKEILLDGITVISTDFEQLGQTAAQLIQENRKAHISNPFHIIFRNSL